MRARLWPARGCPSAPALGGWGLPACPARPAAVAALIVLLDVLVA